MKRTRIALLLLLVLVVFSIAYGITKEEANAACWGEFNNTMANCVGTAAYCEQQAEDAYRGCMALHGYPVID